MNAGLAIQIFATCIACTATLISVLTYRRNLKVELENHIFKQKHEAYSSVAYEISVIFNFFYAHWDVFTHKISDGPLDIDKLDQLEDELEWKIEQLENLVARYSMSLDDKMIDLLDDLLDLFLDDDEALWDEMKDDEKIRKFEKYFLQLQGKADRIIELLREDLRLEKLNTSLFRRIGKGKN